MRLNPPAVKGFRQSGVECGLPPGVRTGAGVISSRRDSSRRPTATRRGGENQGARSLFLCWHLTRLCGRQTAALLVGNSNEPMSAPARDMLH